MKTNLIIAVVALLGATLNAASANWLQEKPEAQWIWTEKSTGGQELFFRHAFELRGKVKSARVYATCDNRLKLWLNGRHVGDSPDWPQPIERDVAAFLKPGGNVIAAAGGNAGGAAAFVLKLAVELADGSKVTVVTDKSWQLRAKVENGWERADATSVGWSSELTREKGKLGVPPWGVPNHGGRRQGNPLDPASIQHPKGFVVDLVHAVSKPDEGSWVSLTTDPQGRFYASDQAGKGLFRITVAADGKAEVERVELKEPDGGRRLSGAQGLVWAFDSLWFHRNGGQLFRVTDTNGDDRLDHVEMMPSERGGGEHGNHAVILTEDGKALYLDGGNHANLAECASSAVTTWDEDLLLPRMWDANGHARGRLAPGGWVTRFDPKTRTQHLICIGFRNQYDIALNRHGDLFTYDADMEWDMGSPWYRPTRICHVVSGGDFGWRSGTGKFPTYYEDSLPPVVDIGPGSPTGVVSGQGTKFPARYQDTIFALDWTYGTIYAIHLQEQGASYTGKIEHFVHASPLPVTDAIVGKDGALYFLVGGRGTQSAMFRVRYTGEESVRARQADGDPKAAAARKLRRELQRFHGRQDAEAITAAWPHLSSKDRFVRHAARVAVESQPVSEWAGRVYREADPQARITGAVALARRGGEPHRAPLLDSLMKLDPGKLTEPQFLGLLRAYALNFIRLGKPVESERQAVIAELDPFLPAKSADLNTELIRVLTYLKAPGVIGKTMKLIVDRGAPEPPDWRELAGRNAGYGGSVLRILDNPPPTRELAYAFMLCNLKHGWTRSQRRDYFAFLNTAAKASGGNSYPGFLTNIREEALANCTDEERMALNDITGEDFNPVPDFPIQPPVGPGREWTLATARGALRGKPDFERGRSLYFAIGCGACHRLAGLGGSVGPDLTSVPHKFDRDYLLEAIIDPSKDISDQYGSSVVTLKNGDQLMGLAVEQGGEMKLYPADVKVEPITIPLGDIQGVKQSPVSQMPAGLLNFLNPEEVRDLVAYLMSGGNPKDRAYRR